jgi:hypothetical protein
LLYKAKFMSGVALKHQGSNDITVVKNIRNYSNDPFVKKKVTNALALIKKHGLPKAKKKNK